MVSMFSAGTGTGIFLLLQRGGLSAVAVDFMTIALAACVLVAVAGFLTTADEG
jgi:hypothetical protein